MLEIRKFDAPLGAEIVGVDLGMPMDNAGFSQIERAFAENTVLLFRNQRITEDQHVAFSRRFGDLEVLGFYQKYLHPGHPEIFVVSNIIENGQPIGLQEAGRIWHTDVSYKEEPSMGSLLYAKEVPHENGTPLGDTLFASTAAAYDALSPEMKNRLQGRTAIHKLDEARYKRDPGSQRQRGTRAALTDEQKRMIKDIEHPVIRTHPVTGRKCIYVNELYTFRIVDMDEEESSQLLAQLYAHIISPKFIYRHKWAVGDLLMWDNCAAQHLAVGDYTAAQRRLMHRTTIRGAAPF